MIICKGMLASSESDESQECFANFKGREVYKNRKVQEEWIRVQR